MIETKQSGLDQMLDILLKNKMNQDHPKFPLIFPESYHQLDFIQKVDYITE